MTVALFISPHFDDVVFSCPIAVQRAVTRGDTVIVATVFSATDSSPIQQDRARADAIACRSLGAVSVALGLIDAGWRDPLQSLDLAGRVLLTPLQREPGTLELAIGALQRLCDQVRPSWIHAPLGVGAHIDHRIVHHAVRRLDTDARRVYYTDQPYGSIAGASALRLRQLGGAAETAPLTHDFAAHFADAPFMVRVCAEPARRLEIGRGIAAQTMEIVTTDRPITPSSSVLRASTAEAAQASRAQAAYGDEALMFLGQDWQHDSETHWEIESSP